MAHTVLIVDDDSFFRSLARDILEQNGFEVLLASSWSNFNEAYYSSKTPPDIILFDINLGTTLSGDKLLKAFRQSAGRGAADKKTKLVILSGMSDEELSRIAKESSADGYIKKTSLNVEYGGAFFMQQLRSFLEE
jgi:CheY-like chemotaxis protein